MEECKQKTDQARLKNLSRALRKNMTKEEKHLWYDFLKHLPVTVNRQKKLGSYIADFFVASKKLAIEVDGSQHFSAQGLEQDRVRDAWLADNGINVLRYTNDQINHEFEGVCRDILYHLDMPDS